MGTQPKKTRKQQKTMSWERRSRQSKVAATTNLSVKSVRVISDEHRYAPVRTVPADADAPVCALPHLKYPLRYHRCGEPFAVEAEQAQRKEVELKQARSAQRRRQSAARRNAAAAKNRRRNSTTRNHDDDDD